MTELTRAEYVSSITDYEKAQLININNDKIYLRADIECGGGIGLRIETMCFELNTKLGFWKANSECRNNIGCINFIEYDSYEDADSQIINDFVSIENNALYLKCRDDELKDIKTKYPDSTAIYVITL